MKLINDPGAWAPASASNLVESGFPWPHICVRQEEVTKAENSHLTWGFIKAQMEYNWKGSCGLGMTLPDKRASIRTIWVTTPNPPMTWSKQSFSFPSLSIENAPVPLSSCRMPGCGHHSWEHLLLVTFLLLPTGICLGFQFQSEQSIMMGKGWTAGAWGWAGSQAHSH